MIWCIWLKVTRNNSLQYISHDCCFIEQAHKMKKKKKKKTFKRSYEHKQQTYQQNPVKQTKK